MNLLDRIQLFWAKNRQVTTRLVMVNVAFSVSVWLVGWILGNTDFASVPEDVESFIKVPYTVVTYMFAHSGFMHLLFNMLILYFVGQVFEDLLGSKKTLQVYLLSGIIGALMFILIVSKNSLLIGASGAIMGLLYGLTLFRPNYQFYLYGIIKLKLWWITIAFAAYDLLLIMASNAQAGGRICHVAGGLTGVVMVAYWTGKLQFKLFKPNKKSVIKPYKITINREPKRATKVNSFQKSNPVPTQEDIDLILDKINESGYDSLTKEEKDTLFRAKDIQV